VSLSVERAATALAEVSALLSWLEPPPVFIGGATVWLYLDAHGRMNARPTKDLDCIVPGVATAAAWFALESDLRAHGWQADRDGPICRYRSAAGHLVDFLAQRPQVQGFAGRWFPEAVNHVQQQALPQGESVRILTVPWLFALKIEAFRDRGVRDPLASRDLEDLAALLDGCAGIESAIAAEGPALRSHIRGWCSEILANEDLREALEAQLPRSGSFDAQRGRLRQRVQRMADSALYVGPS